MQLMAIKKFVQYKHKGQLRKDGITPYVLHPIGVAQLLKEKGFSKTYQIVGLCHDLIEDTDTSYQELLFMTNKEVVEAVRLVTKEPGYSSKEYYERIQKNQIAKMVKLADRIHNLRDARTADANFRNRYLEETKQWFITLAKDTVWEKELLEEIDKLEKVVEGEKTDEGKNT